MKSSVTINWNEFRGFGSVLFAQQMLNLVGQLSFRFTRHFVVGEFVQQSPNVGHFARLLTEGSVDQHVFQQLKQNYAILFLQVKTVG